MPSAPSTLQTSPLWHRLAWSPLPVAGMALLVVAVALMGSLIRDPSARGFIVMGHHFATKGHSSSVIRYLGVVRDRGDEIGYDGQFSYFLAVDPVHAGDYMDSPGYRYGRIGYPMLARLLALGQPGLIPYALLVLNWLALGLGTFCIATLLARARVSPWWALAYGLYPGLIFGVQRDLTEPVAYGLVALGVLLAGSPRSKTRLASGAVFGLAALTRETTLVFGLLIGLTLLYQARKSAQAGLTVPAALILLTVMPLALWRVFVAVWLGTSGVPAAARPVFWPFAGLFAHWPFGLSAYGQIVSVVAPSLLVTGAALWIGLRHRWNVYLTLIVLNVVLFVVLLNAQNYVLYEGSGRAAAGVVLATLVTLGCVEAVARGGRWWLWLTCVLWLLPGAQYILSLPLPVLALAAIATTSAALATRVSAMSPRPPEPASA